MKQRKITVKFFLNDALKAKDHPEYTDSEPAYPLYFQLTYMRKNTQVRSYYGGYFIAMETVLQALMDYEEFTIKKIVRYLINEQGEKFTLKGFGNYYEDYCRQIHFVIENYMRVRLQKELWTMEPHHYLSGLNFDSRGSLSFLKFDILYEMSKKLYYNFELNISPKFAHATKMYREFMRFSPFRADPYSRPTIIDWVNGNMKSNYSKHLNSLYPGEEHKIKERMEFIELLIDNRNDPAFDVFSED